MLVSDGSTVFYDVFEPTGGVTESQLMLVVPGKGRKPECMTMWNV